MTRPRSARRAARRSRIAALRALVADVTASLASRGIGPGDRVGIVLDNGPGDGGRVSAHRLGRDRRAAQPELSRRRVRVLSHRPAREAARRRPRARTRRRSASRRSSACRSRDSSRIRSAAPERSRSSTTAVARRRRKPVRAATPDDIALVLHTSGTTSRPKIVPLAHKNIAASAANIREHAVAHGERSRARHHAAVPHPRPDRRALGATLRRRRSVLLAGLQRAQVLRAGSTR